jgi:hypothetical protein
MHGSVLIACVVASCLAGLAGLVTAVSVAVLRFVAVFGSAERAGRVFRLWGRKPVDPPPAEEP